MAIIKYLTLIILPAITLIIIICNSTIRVLSKLKPGLIKLKTLPTYIRLILKILT